LIDTHGAVSEAVARAMVQGALERAPVQLAVAVTGIAGPGGAVPGKPVGTVWLAWGRPGKIEARRLLLGGNRDAVRSATVAAALQRLLQSAQA
jgi:nicotinamide-nucleotide amidase